jgi:hypothetical protein
MKFRLGRVAELLGVTLRAQPSDATVSIHPVVGVGFAVQAGYLTGLCIGTFS